MIVVITSLPLRSTIHPLHKSGKQMKWLEELSEHDTSFEGKTAIKSKTLPDFIEDFEDAPQTAETTTTKLNELVTASAEEWIL